MSLSSTRPSRQPLSAVDGDTTDWRGVSLGLALSCFVAFQQFKLPPVLPDLLLAFHYSRSLAASFMSVYAVIGLIGSVPLGVWMKRRGYRPGLLLGILSTFCGLLIALILARFGIALLVARGLEGLTYAIFAIAGPAIATSSARLRDLPLVTGLLAGWIPVGQIGAGLVALAAPSLALPIAAWQLMWLVALILTLILGAFCWRYSHQQHVGMNAKSAKAIPTVTADTVTTDNQRAQHRETSATAMQNQAGRVTDLLAAGIFLLWSAQYFAFMTWLTQFLIEQHHLQPQAAILVYLLPVVVLLGCNLLTGWALGHGLKLMPALLVSLVLQGLVWALNPILDGVSGIIALLLYGICAGVIPTCLFHLPHLIAAHRAHGATAMRHVKAGPEAFATLMTGRNVGVFCGPLILPQLLIWLGNWNEAALVIAGFTWLGAIIAFMLARRLR